VYYEIQDLLNEAFPVKETPLTAEFVEQVVLSDSPPDVATPTRLGELRKSYRYVPVACTEESSQCPVLIALHANASSGLAFVAEAGLAAFAEREGTVVEVWDGIP